MPLPGTPHRTGAPDAAACLCSHNSEPSTHAEHLAQSPAGSKRPLLLPLLLAARFPRLIHQTVVNKSRLSCEEKRVIESWKRLNPNHTHQLWDDEDMRKFIVQVSTAVGQGAHQAAAQLCRLCTQTPCQQQADVGFDAHVVLALACLHSQSRPSCLPLCSTTLSWCQCHTTCF